MTMAFFSLDGSSLLGLGMWSMCVECGEGTRDGDEVTRHAPDCPLTTRSEPAMPARTRDPNVYVLTDHGIEREIDVNRRRRPR